MTPPMTATRTPWKRNAIWMISTIVAASFVIAVGRHYASSVRSARLMRAQGSLSQTWFLVERYDEERGVLPDAVIRRAGSEAQMSWRAALLRDAGDDECRRIMTEYETDQIWNSVANADVARRVTAAGFNYFKLPHGEPGVANVLAIVDEQGRWLLVDRQNQDPNSIVLIVDPESTVHAFEPTDASREAVQDIIERDGLVCAWTAGGEFRVVRRDEEFR